MVEDETGEPQVRRRRIRLDFSEEAYDELQKLRARLEINFPTNEETRDALQEIGVPSRAEIVRQGLGCLRYVCEKMEDGDHIVVLDEELYQKIASMFGGEEGFREPDFGFSVKKKGGSPI